MTYELGTRLRKSLPVKTAGSHLRPHALRPIGDWKCATERVDRIAKERHPVGVSKAPKQDDALLRRHATPEMPYYTGSVAAVSAGPVSYKVPSTTSRYATGTYRSGGSLERSYYSSSNTSGSSYLSRSTGSTSSYTTEYRSKFASPARTSSSVPSYSRSSSLSDDTSSRFSSTRDRTEPRRFTASTLTAADIINKYSPSTYVSGGSTASDLGRPPVGSSRTSAAANASSASPISEDKDAGVTTRSSTLRGRAATVASSTSGGRVAAPSLERRSRVAKEDSDVLSVSPHFGRSAQCMGSERGGLSGLRNIGNTCFMNSVIQCLSNTKPLLEYLLGDSYLSDLNTSVSSMKGALIKAFSSVIKELWRENDGMVVNTTSLKSQIQRFAPRFMGYSQQDAQEFLRYLLEGLHEDVNRITSKPKPILTEIDDSLSDQQKATEAWKRYLRMDDSKIVDIFVGQLKSTLRCTVCGHCSVTFDPFWDLSLPIPSRSGQVRLQQCLESFTREEVLDGDEKPTCAKCQTRRKCTKNFTIQKFPKILVLHLKRFSPTERFRGKLSVTVDFPHSGLDLSAYAASRGQGCIYNLYAISNHSGTTYSGHYTAYCRHPYTGDWHEYNDSRVSSISPRSIVSSEAYVLFYELSGHSSHL